jgi:hypothetical protein
MVFLDILPQLNRGVLKYETTLRVCSMHTIKNVCINTGPASSLGYGPVLFWKKKIPI